MSAQNYKIGIIGLGYIGAPLLAAFSETNEVVGYDISLQRILELKSGEDSTGELSAHEREVVSKTPLSTDILDLETCDIYIVTVPTPIDGNDEPDLTAIKSASIKLASVLRSGNVVVYESTVFPGCTEEICVPLLEKCSGLHHLVDFNVGYSPERINPGDKVHKLRNTNKIISADTPKVLDVLNQVYGQVVSAELHKASSIKVAEASKVIENIQRDVNIALMNEFSMLFDRLGIETNEVLAGAATKWNFIDFKPGLVGGHCIGIDPYYLAYKAKEVGFDAKMILAGRDVNERVASHIATKLESALGGKVVSQDQKVLIMGATFKENCPDFRNSKVFDLAKRIETKGIRAYLFDPYFAPESDIDPTFNFVTSVDDKQFDAVIIAVAHDSFKDLGIEKIRAFCRRTPIVFDLKSLFAKSHSDFRL